MDITGAWKRSSVDRLRRVTPAKLFPSRRSSVSRSYEDISQNGRRKRFDLLCYIKIFLLNTQQFYGMPNKYKAEIVLLFNKDSITYYFCMYFTENYELKREVALSQLLQLIELPVVEGIINEAGRTVQKDNMVFNNFAFKQQDSILSANSFNR